MSIDILINEKIQETVTPLINEIRALQEELRSLREHQSQIDVEICGAKNIMKAMGITDQHVISHLVKTGVLGTSLWKVHTSRGNGKMYCTPGKAKSRYQYYLCKPGNVRKAMEAFGMELAEKQWKKLGL